MNKKICSIAVAVVVTFLVFQFTAKSAMAAPIPVFYSVGQNINDHKSGSPTVTISNGTATFSVAQTALNMGVGDRVTYRGHNSVFISGKISYTQWTVVTKLGAAPSNVTDAKVDSIRHEFKSLFEAVSFYASPPKAFDADHLNTSNLVTGNYVLHIPLYYDTGPEIVAGGQLKTIQLNYLTTGPDNYIKIYTPYDASTEVNQSQRHNGKWDSQKYNIEFRPTVMHTSGLTTHVPYTKIDGLQIKIISDNRDNGGLETAYANGGWIEFSNNIITGQILQFSIGIKFLNTGGTTNAKIWNNLIYDLRGPVYGSSAGIMFDNCYGGGPCGSGVGYIYNNTVVNAQFGITNGTIYHVNAAGVMVAKNNLIQDTDPSDYLHPNPGFDGNFAPSSDYNITDNGDAPGSHSKRAIVSFVDKAGKDFGLASSDVAAQDAGISLASDSNLAFSTDINGQTRVVPWDIGANEIDVPVFSSVSLISTNGTSGNPLLDTSLKADATYTGPVIDRVNYTFWWNCNDSSNNVAYLRQTSVCGDPTDAAIGAKFDNQPGETADTSLTSNRHVYLPGAYVAKVVVERGMVSPAERRLPLNVTNTPPSTANVTITEPDYCLSGSAVFVSLTFSDFPGDTQSAYQVQIDDESAFNSPEVDSGKFLSPNSTFFSGQGLLQFNTTYRARVRVWDSGDLVSPWANQSICFGPGCAGNDQSWKTPKHPYPLVNFSWLPLKPLISQSITFTDGTTFYDGGGTKTWNWTAPSAIPPSGTLSTFNTKYTVPGIYTVTDTVTDKDGYSCALSQPVTVQKSIPIWKEIIVSLGINKLFTALGLSF